MVYVWPQALAKKSEQKIVNPYYLQMLGVILYYKLGVKEKEVSSFLIQISLLVFDMYITILILWQIIFWIFDLLKIQNSLIIFH